MVWVYESPIRFHAAVFLVLVVYGWKYRRTFL